MLLPPSIMNPENTALATIQPQHVALGYSDSGSFDHTQRVATMFSKSALVPTQFQNNVANCVIALEMAARMGASAMAVMQALTIIHGRPSWSSTFIIATINSCGRFEPLMFELSGTGDQRKCVAWTTPRGAKLPKRDDSKQWTIDLAKESGFVVLDGPECSIEIAKKEGWFQKNGSKWQTMPELMLRYRAAAFFGRIHAPELLMGMKSVEEVIDVESTIIRTDEPPVVFNKQTKAPPEPEATGGSQSDSPSNPSPEPEPAVVLELWKEVEEFYKSECGATFENVMATAKRATPWGKLVKNATSFKDLPEKHLAFLSSARRGFVIEVKRDMEAATTA